MSSGRTAKIKKREKKRVHLENIKRKKEIKKAKKD